MYGTCCHLLRILYTVSLCNFEKLQGGKGVLNEKVQRLSTNGLYVRYFQFSYSEMVEGIFSPMHIPLKLF